MVNFFSKPKLNSRAASKDSELAVAGPSKLQSNFDKHFKPFILRKDTTLAPINWFHETKRQNKCPTFNDGQKVITIDIDEDQPPKEDVEMQTIRATEDVSGWDAHGLCLSSRL